ncbi:MAG TPA: hypothetical protein VL309_02530 [Vicinamibacterales bacterium]|jgi:hypothetical protein|nr:hypothetical protein [Vicinamibacterales bacterium]
MAEITFKYGSLIRGGPKQSNGGKWDAMLDEDVRNARTNADLTIYIRVHFSKIDPAGKTGVYPDSDNTAAHPSKPAIQKWAPGEFELFTRRLVTGAQRFWNGVFWLKTPARYKDLDWPDGRGTHRCHLYCRFELEQVLHEKDAHYTIAVVRVRQGQAFRSNSRLYSQLDIVGDHRIPHSTAKFWTHVHEVGHLLGLGHVGHGHKTNVHHDNTPQAYGVTQAEMQDVMGRGSHRHAWHARPWQEGAEGFTGIPAKEWLVEMQHVAPTPIAPARR